MATTSPLPEGAHRLFPDHDPEDLRGEEGRSLLCARLLEDGDSADLRWLVGQLGEPAIVAWLAAHGGRQLSSRSRAFWARTLRCEAGPANPVAAQLWAG